MRLPGRLGAAAVLLVLLVWGRAAMERREDAASASLLYLPNGTYLKALSLGHSSVLADWMYVWALQYYGNYDRADRYAYVDHVFRNVIAELDPRYVDAYWMGALILSVEAKDLPAALALLDTGLEKNPDAWVLPYLAAWECYHARRFEQAETYFAKAASIPGAPAHVRRMQLGMIGRQGNLDRAIAAWLEVREDPDADGMLRAVANRQLNTLVVERDCRLLEQAAALYRDARGALPPNLETLAREGWISGLPLDPQGHPYRYDRSTGRVTSLAGRLLGSR